ncbi:MAG: GtrA family protein [Syntrophobacteraceae bacterium]
MRDLVALIYSRRVTLARFVASGCSAATVEFSLLFLLTHYLGFHYLVSSSLAFAVAVCVGFTLQKFWTFENSSLDYIHRQAIQYLSLGLANLGINAVLMFFFVESLHLWYMFAQFVACGMMAGSNFLIYNLFIFKTDG